MAYTITRIPNNQYTFTVTSGTPYDVKVLKKEKCESTLYTVIVSQQTIATTGVITIPNIDGYYVVSITQNSITTTPLTIEIHDNLLKNLIKNLKTVLCKCDCNCQECEEEINYEKIMAQFLAYNMLTIDKYSVSLSFAFSCISCNVSNSIDCNLLNEKVIGNSSNGLLMKKLLAYYYLVYYYRELSIITVDGVTPQNKALLTAELNVNYDYDAMLVCIQELNMNTECILNKIITLY